MLSNADFVAACGILTAGEGAVAVECEQAEGMYSKIYSYAARGLEAEEISVEVTILNGFPSFAVSGLRGESSLQLECRLRAALANSGYSWPQGRIIVALSPAWMRSEGSAYDFPIAIALLEASAQIQRAEKGEKLAFLGELCLDGRIQSVPGFFPCLEKAAEAGDSSLVIPYENAEDAAFFADLKVALSSSLEDGVDSFRGLRRAMPLVRKKEKTAAPRDYSPWAHFAGQHNALMALELACAGWHSLLLLGSPGCGKTFMATLASALLPDLAEEEERSLRKIYSIAGKGAPEKKFDGLRPFFQPHHSVSPAALSGGGNPPRPGLFSYAHRGILFLDEMMEIRPERLDLLRGPLEGGTVEIARSSNILKLPADFLLIGAGNPCRCGYALEEGGRSCRCSEKTKEAYRQRLSGPLLQRFHLRLHMQCPKENELLHEAEGCRRFQAMQERIEKAWERQRERARKLGLPAYLNGRCPEQISAGDLGCPPSLYRLALSLALDLSTSARGLRQLLLLARTAADLEGRKEITEEDLLLVCNFISWESRT